MGCLGKAVLRDRAHTVGRAVFAFQLREAGFNGEVALAGDIIFGIGQDRRVFLIIGGVSFSDNGREAREFSGRLVRCQILDRCCLAHAPSNNLPAAARASAVTSAPDSIRAISSCLLLSSSPRMREPPAPSCSFSTSH